ncbi:MAG: hypothetical protein EBV03_10945, partial [Proteobacteria bacterium]|nr:hypothetical protein [Pseudomonadota bacterium]
MNSVKVTQVTAQKASGSAARQTGAWPHRSVPKGINERYTEVGFLSSLGTGAEDFALGIRPCRAVFGMPGKRPKP